MPFELSDVLGAIQGAIGKNSGTSGGIQSAYGAAKSANSDSAQASIDAINAKKTIDLQKDTGELQAQNNTIRAATALGTNMNDPSEIVSVLGAQMRNAALMQAQSAAQVQDLESNNDLFLNPVGWLRDFTYGDQARNRLAGATANLKATFNGLQSLNIATTQSAQTQKAIAQTKSAATVQAQQEIDAAAATKALAESKKANALLDVRMLNDVASLDARNTSLVLQGYNAQVQDQNRQLQRQQTDLMIQAKQERAKSIQEQKAAEDQQTHYLNVAQTKFGLPLSTSAKVDASISTLGKTKTEALIGIGQQIEASKAAGREWLPPVFGKDFFDAHKTMTEIGVPIPPAMDKMYSNVVQYGATATNPDVLQQALISSGVATGDSPEKIKADAKIKAMIMLATAKGQQQAQVIVAQTRINSEATSPFINQESNPYAPPPLTTLDWTGLNTNKFLSTYVTPSIIAATQAKQPLNLNPDTLLKSAISAAYGSAKDKPTTSEISEGIAGLAQQLILQNNATKNYHSFALPSQSSMNVSVMTSSGKAITVNLADPSSVQKFLAANSPSILPKLLQGYSDIMFGGKGRVAPLLP